MNKKNSISKSNYLAILANMLIPIGGISTDIYLPSLPAMSQHFAVSKALIQLTISVFVFAMAFGQYLAGAVSDALGRKKLIILALIIQGLCLVGILTTQSIYTVLLCRFIQGLAVAFLMVPSRAIINDLFHGEDLRKKLSYLTISFAMSPILAPFLGGYLQHYFGWQSNFYFILIYLFIAFILVMFTLPETIASTKKFSLSHIVHNTAAISKNKYFIIIAIFAGTMMGFSTLFSLVGPFMVQDVLKHSAIVYGHMALIIGAAWLLGNMTNRLFFNIRKSIKIPLMLLLTFLSILTMLLLSTFKDFNLVSLVSPIFFMVFASAWIFGVFVAEGLSIFKTLAASANAVFFSIGWFMFGLVSVIATFLKVHSMMPLAITYLIINCFCIIVYFSTIRKHE